ncbi:hypothetical protein KEM56_006209 [Ascosphaera pollenicola]|nr:hypothetical protein KEM56_006209 [Ascosphaera pollenicola]
MDARKRFTCPFWATAGCKNSDEECKFAHHNTGRMGKFPHNYVRNRVRQSPAINVAPKNDEDLISISDTEEQTLETSDESSPHTSSSREVEETPVIQSIPASRPEDVLVKKPDQPNIFFHAVKWGKTTLLRELLEAAKSTDIVGNNSIPLLAYAAIQHPISEETIKLLLAYQFNPCMIPKSLWNQDRDGVASERMQLPEWCTPVVLMQLRENLDQGLRYTFQRAARLQSSMAEEVRIARMVGTRALLEAPYQIVGRDYAIEVVSNVIRAQSSCSSDKPLMLAFVGPETIINFTRKYDPGDQNTSQSAPWGTLTSTLDNELTEAFGERLVIAQRLIGDLRRRLLQHGVSFTNPESRRNHRIRIDLMIKQMQAPKVCCRLTKRYNPRLGAHSIAQEVRRQIEVPLVNMCLRLIARGTLPLLTSDGRVSGIATVSAKMENDAIVLALEER